MENFIREKFVKGPYGHSYIYTPVSEEIYHCKSDYQDIWVVKTPFGKTLVLDGIIQLTEHDEKLYHEALVYPAFKPNYRKVLILGGGDGGAARELLKLSNNLSITIVDIDPMVTEVVKKYMPEVPAGAFEIKNVKLINMDAWKFIDDTKIKYDYILVDLTDCREEEYQVNKFYKKEFMAKLKKALKRGGRTIYFLGLYPVDKDIIMKFLNEARAVFKYYKTYGRYIPSFGGIWTYIVLSNNRIRLGYIPDLIDISIIDKDL